jgi:hypothetical protein
MYCASNNIMITHRRGCRCAASARTYPKHGSFQCVSSKTQRFLNALRAVHLLPRAFSNLFREPCSGKPPFSARTKATDERAGGDSAEQRLESQAKSDGEHAARTNSMPQISATVVCKHLFCPCARLSNANNHGNDKAFSNSKFGTAQVEGERAPFTCRF